MHDIAYLNFHRARLEAFKTGELFDVNPMSAEVFEQPVAFTRELVRHIVPEHRSPKWQEWGFILKMVKAAHAELVTAAGRTSTTEPVTVDFSCDKWTGLRVMFHFVSDPGSGVTVPAVTIGFTDEFE